MMLDKIDLLNDKLDIMNKNLIKRLDKIERDVEDLKSFKNKVLGGGIALSALFAYIFDYIKNLLTK